MKLSILIPTIEKRKDMLLTLVDTLLDQCDELEVTNEVEIIPLLGSETIGYKRNKLFEMAKGEYVCFFDDDDEPSVNYINHLFIGMSKGVDCCSLKGVMTTNGTNPEIFEHSLRYDAYRTTDNYIKYERYPNHLNCIKASIAKQFKFPEINHGEDTDFATQIHKSGLLKTEHYIPEVIYHYKYISNK